jgi:hypothetical protein
MKIKPKVRGVIFLGSIAEAAEEGRERKGKFASFALFSTLAFLQSSLIS